MKLNFRRKLAAVAVAVLATGVVGFVATPQGHADLQNPRQNFLRASTAGLFLHWGERTSPSHTSCSGWENDVTSGGWSADYWVTEAQKLHASYLVLATFHSRLGYARPWPSKVPGSCATKRDFLGELITAAHAKGLEVICYMTNDAQWHNETGHEWLDSAAYSSYKGKTVNIDTQDGFGQFSYDNFFDVMSSHPALDGFWIDNDNQYWLDHNLYQQIYNLHPNMTISNNNEDTPIMDMISNEQKTGMTPAYDMPQAYYTAAPRLTEADYKLPSSGAWWYDGSNSSVNYGLNIGRYIANAGNTVLSLLAETAMVNGKFPSNQVTFNNFMNTYLPPIWASIGNTYGGGFMYGGMPGGAWNNGAYGYTTVSRSNADKQYIHVITPPSGSTFRLRDNGYVVTKVTNLRTGSTVSFNQGSGFLTLSGLSGWDQYDTVFTVTTSGRTGIESGVTATANHSASGHPAGNLVDGSYLNYWDNGGTLTDNLTFDQGSSKHVAYLGINQREDTITQTASSSHRIHNYKILTSNDNSTWSTLKSGTLPNVKGAQFVDVGATARYIRLEVDTLYSSSDTLRIDEAWLATAYATGDTQPPPPANRVEAESGTCDGTIDSNHTGFSGTGFCNTTNAAGAALQVTVTATTAGAYPLTIRYSNGTTGDRPADITVNGTVVSAAHSFPVTANWDTWTSATVTVNLDAGANTVRIAGTTAGGAPNLDYVES
jgi:alpha-L-fucosidase